MNPKTIEIDIIQSSVYNRTFKSEKAGNCFAYVKHRGGKSYKLTYDCAKESEISQDWNGELMWDQVDLLRSNPALLGFEEIDEAEQIYVDGLGGPDAEERLRRGEDDSRDSRFQNMQMASLDPKSQLSNWNVFDKSKEGYWKREYPAYSPRTDTSKKYPPTESPVGTPGKWKPLVWRQELPDYAPKTNESTPKNVLTEFSKKDKEQSIQNPKEPDGRMKVPMAKEISHYELDLNQYAEKDFYRHEYPGLGPNSKTAKADEVTHYNGLYQEEFQAIPQSPVNVPKKFKYKIGQRKTYDNQWKLLIEAPTRLFKEFQVATQDKKCNL